jgi:hypothetical protein
MSTVTAISFKPKATRKRLKKEILSDDFKKRKNFLEKYCGKFSVWENFLWKIFHLTSLVTIPTIRDVECTFILQVWCSKKPEQHYTGIYARHIKMAREHPRRP